MTTAIEAYEPDPLVFLLSQNLMINSVLIYVFCTSFEHKIVFVLICRTGRMISGSQLVQNKELVVKFWIN